MDYDFSQLNDKEFEHLVADLLSQELGTRVERFKSGRDGGVDGRAFSAHGGEIIIQCKHYLKTGYPGLLSKIKKNETKKVKILSPERYIFATTVELSRKNKEELKKIFSPYIIRETDIYSQSDLNDLLKKHPEIEKNHFKLWINSTNVLKLIFNAAIVGRSNFEIEQIHEKSQKYALSESHNEALKKIEKDRILIISGEPGIGKTTLAEMIALNYFISGFEFYSITSSLNEAENIYENNKKQIFYYDDFLGSNYLNALENKKDAQIIKFIERIKKDNKKIFILTSRTNIFNSSIEHSQYFKNKKIYKNEYLLNINNYTNFDKAKILYNHIWFSCLHEEYIEQVYTDKRYHHVVEHKNFNPRLIEFITDKDRVDDSHCSALDYWEHIKNNLNNPKDIWKDCFNYQSNQHVRNLVFIVVFNGNNISEDDLVSSYNRIQKIETNEQNFNHSTNFNTIAPTAIRSFLDKNIYNEHITYSLFNPSIADFIISEHLDDDKKIENIFKSLRTEKSLETLFSMKQRNILNKKTIEKILSEILKSDDLLESPSDYLLDLAYKASYASNITHEEQNSILNKVLIEGGKISNITYLLDIFFELKDELSNTEIGFITYVCSNKHRLDESEITELDSFLISFNLENSSLKECLEDKISDYIYNEAYDLNEFDFEPYIALDDYQNADYSVTDIESALSEKAKDIFNGISLIQSDLYTPNTSFEIDHSEVESAIYDSLRSEKTTIINKRHQNQLDFINEIDDLFDRT